MKNKHGLDSNYFKEKLAIIARNVDRYTPREMQRELSRLARVAEEARRKEDQDKGEECPKCGRCHVTLISTVQDKKTPSISIYTYSCFDCDHIYEANG